MSVVPTIFEIYHNSPSGGHFNGLNTYEKIRLLYFWPTMGQDILKKCAMCHGCQSTRPRRPDKFGRMSITPATRPFERVSVDLIKLPQTQQGNTYIVVFIDEFTRWPEAMAIHDKKQR
jgi:Integrase zinc binding domain